MRRIEIGKKHTINMGNYESISPSVSISFDVPEDPAKLEGALIESSTLLKLVWLTCVLDDARLVKDRRSSEDLVSWAMKEMASTLKDMGA